VPSIELATDSDAAQPANPTMTVAWRPAAIGSSRPPPPLTYITTQYNTQTLLLSTDNPILHGTLAFHGLSDPGIERLLKMNTSWMPYLGPN
jgi:hypothetical protein